MSKLSKALLVFCEGAHDVAFCRLVLKHCFAARKLDAKFSQYPSPFDKLFKKSLEEHAASDLALDMAHKFFLPDRTLETGDWLVLLFNSGGKSKPQNPRLFLEKLLVLQPRTRVFSKGAVSVIEEMKWLFVYDADNRTPAAMFGFCREAYRTIGEMEWIPEEFNAQSDDPCAGVSGEKAVYIWAPEPFTSGTLEDSLLPMFEEADDGTKNLASRFVDEAFVWDTSAEKAERRVAEVADRKKAIITLMGQRKKPGSSMSVILDQAKLVSREQFLSSAAVRRFERFVRDFTGLAPAAPEAEAVIDEE